VTTRQIAAAVARMPFGGFGGECFRAALWINEHVFAGKGQIVGAANAFWLARGRFLGHVAVLHNGKFWDADAHPKGWDDVESWGMLDPHDPDYDAPGFDDEAAETVTRLDGQAAVEIAWREP
jgi:hypothetical protein